MTEIVGLGHLEEIDEEIKALHEAVEVLGADVPELLLQAVERQGRLERRPLLYLLGT